jgi:adenylosuccinate synthase
MPVTVVVGGQFGSEGKGKVAHYLASAQGAVAAVRVGGSNSGHSAVDRTGRLQVLRVLPTAALLDDVVCVLGPGSYIDPALLLDEVARVDLDTNRLIIDKQAFVLTDADVVAERASGLVAAIGSTGSGTGAAVMRRVRREGPATFAANDERLAPFTADTSELLRGYLDAGERVIVEGTQGFGLSLLHSDYWPKATSRDTTAAAAIAEAGLSPLDVDDVVLVFRTFPIRVAGPSGPLGAEELTWSDVAREAGLPDGLVEHTSVSNQVRRVARMDFELVRRSIAVNRPSTIVLNHLDYVAASAATGQYQDVIPFIREFERHTGRATTYLGASAGNLDARSRVLSNA